MRTVKPTTRVLLAAALLGLTGCVSTFKEIKPLTGGPPPNERPSVLMVGELRISDNRIAEPEQKVLANAFQIGVQKWCAAHKAIEIRKDACITNLPPNSIVLDGKITEIEKGSAAARFWVGMVSNFYSCPIHYRSESRIFVEWAIPPSAQALLPANGKYPDGTTRRPKGLSA